jgi:hypothetical protein
LQNAIEEFEKTGNINKCDAMKREVLIRPLFDQGCKFLKEGGLDFAGILN